MKTGDMVILQAPARDDVAIFIDRLPYDRMCVVEIIKEKNGKKYKSVDAKEKGVRYLTKQKYCTLLLTKGELSEIR